MTDQLSPADTAKEAMRTMSVQARLAVLGVNPQSGLAAPDVQLRLQHDGYNDVPQPKHHPLAAFARKFWGLSAWMLELIAILSFTLGKRADFWIAIALLVVNAVLSFLQEERASAAVTALRLRLRISARALRDGVWQSVPARELVPGDIVRIRAGDFVPADLQVVDGDLRVDQSALTGESQDAARSTEGMLFSGSMVRRGEATAVVIQTGTRTYFGRTAQLVETAHPKLHIEEVVTRVVRWLFLIVGSLVALTLVVSLLKGSRLIDILPLSLVLLMSAVPVALPVMFTVSMAVGSMELARRGVLVTRLSAAEDAATMDVVCADKTGTLTMNRLELVEARPQPGYTIDDVARDGALASNEANQDAIDLAFLRAARKRDFAGVRHRLISFAPFSPETRRTEAVVEIGGHTIRTMKGALRTIGPAAGLDEAAIAMLEAEAQVQAIKGYRALAVARSEDGGPLALVGLAFLYDAPRPDSRELIDELRSLGVRVKMLTGDALPVANEIARELAMGRITRAPELRTAAQSKHAITLVEASDGFAEVFPEDKFLVVKSLQDAGHVVGMTGDGVNDAPALRQAEVGIAVDRATDVAKGAASAVLTTEGLAGIIDLVRNGRAIYQRMLTWIVNKISRTILKAGFVVIAFLATGRFVISALGMVLLVFMTDFVKIALSTDQVQPSRNPETWNIGPLVGLAALLGVLLLAEALGVLFMGWRVFHLGDDHGRLQTFTFEVLLFFALFSIVSIRERRSWTASAPSRTLSVALLADAAAGLGIAAFGLGELTSLSPAETALAVVSAFVCALLFNDRIKTIYIARYWQPGRTGVATC